MAWWVWMVLIWAAVSAVLAVPVGRALRIADRRERGLALPPRPRRVPVPPIAVVLIGIGVVLEFVGFTLRTAGLDRGTARLLSMDQPLSLPRMYITGIFAAAALAAFLGASRLTGRRSWWIGVGVVAAVIAEVKGGGTVHVRTLRALGVAGHPVLAILGSVAVAVAVLAGLWWLSRTERRDRRRVLSAFGLYAIASVVLSGVSSLLGQSLGASTWTAAATFVEESGEAVGAVAVLIAVLVGVAPRLVLPADWALRRAEDASTVDAPWVLPTWSTGSDVPRP